MPPAFLPSQASPQTILEVDRYGTALVLEEVGDVIARGAAGVVIASQSGHRLPPLSVELEQGPRNLGVRDGIRNWLLTVA
jgi:hypothetical protein